MSTPLNIQTATQVVGTGSITESSYVVPAGSNKKLFVNVTSDSLDTAPTCTATFDGNAMVVLGTAISNVYADYTARTTFFSYDLGSSTPTGDVVGNFINTNNVKSMMIMYTLAGLVQQAPEATETTFTDGFDDQFVTDSITTITTNAFIASAAHGDVNSALSPDGSGHTEIVEDQDLDTDCVLGYVDATSTTAYTLGWSNSEGTGWGQVLCAFELAPTVTRDQDKFRIYDEDGSALAAEDATPDIAITVPFVPVANTQMTGDPPAESPTWYYRKVGDADSELEKLVE